MPFTSIKKKKVFHYTAIFEPDEEAGGFSVTIPALPGCISEGDTFEEAFKNIREAAELYVETMQAYDRKIYKEEAGVVVAPIQIQVPA